MRNPEMLNDDIIREAHKINKLVDEGEITTTEASESSEERIDELVKYFDQKFSQNYHHPSEMTERAPGQIAEEVLVEFLNDGNDVFSARRGTSEEDANGIDIVLNFLKKFEDAPDEIKIQTTAQTDPKEIEAKLKRLTPEIILVITESIRRILKAKETQNVRDRRAIRNDFMRQVFGNMLKNPIYRPTLRHLQELIPPK